MIESKSTMAQQVAQAASTFQHRKTGITSKAVTVVQSAEAMVITLRDVLTPTERFLAQTDEGTEKVEEARRRQFAVSFDTLRKEIKRITGVEVCEAVSKVEATKGVVIHTFTTVATAPLVQDECEEFWGSWSGS